MQRLLSNVVFLLLLCRMVNAQTLYPTSAGGVGAVYTMSNGVPMNQILIQRLSANGNLTMVGAINTNGTGVNNTSPDVLYSQGSLTTCSNYLFAVNAGSNTLSMFMINPSDATQLTLLSVQPTFGWFPVSVAVNSMYACVLTGGNITGIRCFTFNSSGLFMMSSFDRNLTSYISQSVPPVGLSQTMSQISFSADNLTLIVAVKGTNAAIPGYLLFFPFTNSYTTLSNPIKMVVTGAIWPFSITLVGTNGLLLTDAGANGALTLTYSSSNGSTNNNMLTPINSTVASALCWSTYSPVVGNYYVIGGAGAIVELNVNLGASMNPVKIIRYYQVPLNNGAGDATVVTLTGQDYLYVIGAPAYVINGFQLYAAGNATMIVSSAAQQGSTSTTNIPALAGIAAFVQTQSSPTTSSSSSSPATSSLSSSGASLFTSIITIAICIVAISFGL